MFMYAVFEDNPMTEKVKLLGSNYKPLVMLSAFPKILSSMPQAPHRRSFLVIRISNT
jgi:hypothetical protein